MNITKLIIGISILFSLTGCNDWLTVTPKDSLDEDQLFATGAGYRNALHGIYKNMASNAMYGKEMTWGTLDVLGQVYYAYYLPDSYESMSNYKYEDENAKTLIDGMWSKTYNAIANSNNLLSRIGSEDPSKFSGGEMEKNTIEGEALALRALLHFDMLRLFAPAKEESNTTYIPYFEKYPSTYEPNLSISEFMEKVIRDLEKAKTLVAPTDTVSERRDRLNSKNRFTMGTIDGNIEHNVTDLFEAYRGFRINYYAINGVLARAYAFIGKYEEAFNITEEIITAVDNTKQRLFSFTPNADVEENPKTFLDLLFGLSNEKLADNYTAEYNATGKLYVDHYTITFDDNADYRNTKLLTKSGTKYFSTKYLPSSINSITSHICAKLIPMVRLSEMYYIRAEYYASINDFSNAIKEMDIVRDGRECTNGRLDDIIKDEKSFRKELIKEAQREFIGEGQVFFYFKKFNQPIYSSMKESDFTLPLPDSETIL